MYCYKTSFIEVLLLGFKTNTGKWVVFLLFPSSTPLQWCMLRTGKRIQFMCAVCNNSVYACRVQQFSLCVPCAAIQFMCAVCNNSVYACRVQQFSLCVLCATIQFMRAVCNNSVYVCRVQQFSLCVQCATIQFMCAVCNNSVIIVIENGWFTFFLNKLFKNIIQKVSTISVHSRNHIKL